LSILRTGMSGQNEKSHPARIDKVYSSLSARFSSSANLASSSASNLKIVCRFDAFVSVFNRFL